MRGKRVANELVRHPDDVLIESSFLMARCLLLLLLCEFCDFGFKTIDKDVRSRRNELQRTEDELMTWLEGTDWVAL